MLCFNLSHTSVTEGHSRRPLTSGQKGNHAKKAEFGVTPTHNASHYHSKLSSFRLNFPLFSKLFFFLYVCAAFFFYERRNVLSGLQTSSSQAAVPLQFLRPQDHFSPLPIKGTERSFEPRRKPPIRKLSHWHRALKSGIKDNKNLCRFLC